MEILGDRIKYLREKMNYTQKDLAKKAGLTVVQLSRYETNDRKPDPDSLKRIADVLDTSADYLLGRIDNPKRYENNMSFYGGPEQYTQDEIEEMEAALERYRAMKRRAAEQAEKDSKN